jgi:hypothetical protein
MLVMLPPALKTMNARTTPAGAAGCEREEAVDEDGAEPGAAFGEDVLSLLELAALVDVGGGRGVRVEVRAGLLLHWKTTCSTRRTGHHERAPGVNTRRADGCDRGWDVSSAR